MKHAKLNPQGEELILRLTTNTFGRFFEITVDVCGVTREADTESPHGMVPSALSLHHPLRFVSITTQMGGTQCDDAEVIRPYGTRLGFDMLSARSLYFSDIHAMSAAAKELEKRLGKFSVAEGYAEEFSEQVMRLARALGIKMMLSQKGQVWTLSTEGGIRYAAEYAVTTGAAWCREQRKESASI